MSQTRQLHSDQLLKAGDTCSIDDSPLIRITRVVYYYVAGNGSGPELHEEFRFNPATKIIVKCPHWGQIAGKYCQDCGERV